MDDPSATQDEVALDAFADWERESWEDRAAPYAEHLVDLTRGGAGALLDAAEVTAGTSMLDVGTGPGTVAERALRRGAAVTGVDQSAQMCALARRLGITVHQAPADELPGADGSYDAVVAGFLVNHLARPLIAVREMARLLKPGGRLAVSVWDQPEANPALGLFGPVAAAVAGPVVAAPAGPDPVRYADDDVLLALLADAGLQQPRVVRATWQVTVEPGAWFDAVAAGTPRTGAVLAAVDATTRAAMRTRYIEVATEQYGGATGQVVLPATAVIGSAVIGSGRRAGPAT